MKVQGYNSPGVLACQGVFVRYELAKISYEKIKEEYFKDFYGSATRER
jgi:hypothetical protein